MTFKITLALIAMMLVLASTPAMAIERSTTTTTVRTDTSAPSYYDYERFYSGTKPAVAQRQYLASRYMNEFPRTSLAANQIRPGLPYADSGTKPAVQNYADRNVPNARTADNR